VAAGRRELDDQIRHDGYALGPAVAEMIRVKVMTAAAAYMSLTAASTGAGAAGRSGPPGWPLDG
jgi:hypothetical protein